ncbi:MAG: DoxX family protein [Sediminicola sp.]
MKIISWSLRILPALILLQTLFYKFTAAPESVHIFSQLGAEPYGRWGLGLVELFTAISILIPKTSLYGAIIGSILMAGALGSHLLVLGISVQGDGGKLFVLAVTTFVSCALYIFLNPKVRSLGKSRREQGGT